MPYVCFNNYTQMKRVIYIAFVAAGLLTVSCSKENIQPNNVDSDALPVWRSSSDGGSVDEGTIVDDGTITDPNNDRDENARRRN
jgi:hypothetical protein